MSNIYSPPPHELSKDSKKPFYIIAVPFNGNGLFSIFSVCLGHILYAFEQGFIPIVDLKHYLNQYFKDGKVFRDNVWEYFFKQPLGFCLDDISSDTEICIGNPETYYCLLPIKKYIKQSLSGNYKDDAVFDIIKFNDSTQEYLDENHQKIVNGETEVLGILCRGTDYAKLCPEGHSIQPDIKDVINKAKEILQKYPIKKIWLATEDLEIYRQFKKEFGDLLLENNQYKYQSTDMNYISDIEVKRSSHAYNLAKEYLLSVYILSKCKYLIGGQTSAMSGLWYFSRGFWFQKYTCFWDIGFYKVSSRPVYNSFLERLFSFKDQLKEDKKLKVITIFGIKLKIPCGSNKHCTIGFKRD